MTETAIFPLCDRAIGSTRSASVWAGRGGASALVLFGYTGLSTLALAAAGARVTHVDASKPAVRWAQENQQRSGLEQRPVRWLVDDVGKFVAREARRGARYDIILLDPPVFGRGPRGEVWRLHEQLTALVDQCAALLSDSPLAVLLSASRYRAALARAARSSGSATRS